MGWDLNVKLQLLPLTPEYMRAYRAECAVLLNRIPTTDTNWSDWVSESIERYDRGDRSRFDPAFSFVVCRSGTELKPPAALVIANVDPEDSALPYRGNAVYLSKVATDPRFERLGLMSALVACTFMGTKSRFPTVQDRAILFTKVDIRNIHMTEIIRESFGGRARKDDAEIENWAKRGGNHNVYEWDLAQINAKLDYWNSKYAGMIQDVKNGHPGTART